MKCFNVKTLEHGKLRNNPVCTSSAKSAKYSVEQFFRENLLFDHKVISVSEITYEEWESLVYSND